MLKKFLFPLGLFTISLLLAATQAQTVNDPAAVFARYIQAVNSADKSGLRDLISENVERSNYFACTPAMSNRDCLVYYVVSTVIDKHGAIKDTESFGVDGGTVYGGLELRSDSVQQAGVERVVGVDEIKTNENMITGLKFLPNLRDAQTKKYFDRIRTNAMRKPQS